MASHQKMSEENLEKKMQSLTNTQDSIQGLSLWLIHHKSHHKRVIDVWLQTLRKSSIKQRLILFNLCNDVVQNGKRKKAMVYLESFREVLKEAASLVRDKSVKPNVERIFKIWSERNVFSKDFIAELKEILDSPATSAVPTPSPSTPANSTPAYKPAKVADEEKILAEFKPQKLIDKIVSYKRLEAEVELKAKQLNNLKLDASSVEAVKQLKDRAHGKQFSKQFEDSCTQLENYVSSANKQLSEQNVMIDLLEQSEVFYDEQYREAKIVANAYKNFGTRINNLRKKLDDLIKSLPSPVPSPSYDAPSPGNTPPLEQIDNNEAVDMDLDDEEAGGSSSIVASDRQQGQRAFTAIVPCISQPISSVIRVTGKAQSMAGVEASDPADKESYDPEELYSPSKPKYQATSNALESRIATMIPTLPTNSIQHLNDPRAQVQTQATVAENTPVYNPPPKLSSIKVLQAGSTGGDGTPNDEGSSTPVMDEKEDSPPPAKHQNPIDFLTQILAKTTKTTQQSSNFLQNLSLLTNTVKNQFQQQKDAQQVSQGTPIPPSGGEPVPPVNSGPSSWAEWKAQREPEEVPPPQQSTSPTPVVPAVPMQSIPPPQQMYSQNQPPMLAHSAPQQAPVDPGHANAAMVSPPVVTQPSMFPSPQPPSLPPLNTTLQPPAVNLQSPSYPPPPRSGQPPPRPDGWMIRPLPPSPQGNPVFPQQRFLGPPNPPVSVGYQVGQGDQPGQVWNPPNPPQSQSSPPWSQHATPPVGGPPPPWSQQSPVEGQTSPPWGHQSTPQAQTSPTWSQPPHEQSSSNWNRPSPWDGPQNVDLGSPPPQINAPPSAPSLPPAPKGILRNRKSSLKEVPITPSADEIGDGDRESESVIPKPPGLPPGLVDHRPKYTRQGSGQSSHGHTPDDHKEFLEKLKRKTASNNNSNLISPPVMEDSNSSGQALVFARNTARPNLTTIMPVDLDSKVDDSQDKKDSVNSAPSQDTDQHEEDMTGGVNSEHYSEDENADTMKIQTIQIERKHQDKSDDIRLLDHTTPKDRSNSNSDMNHGSTEQSHFRENYRPHQYPDGPPPFRPPNHRGHSRGGFPDHFRRGPPFHDPYRPPPPPRRPYYDTYDPYRRPYHRY